MGKDPAYLFYPADAAQDVSHMNRLERGCYFDIIQAQKKFGRLSEEIIKKVLGNDFEQCWSSIKICLTCVDHMYFIEWLEESIEKRKSYSESRKNNRKGKNINHMNNTCESYDKHMENENENVIENEIINKTSLEELRGTFLKEVNSHTDYSAEMLKDFFEYWSESDPSTGKMKFQLQEVWETEKRLERWLKKSCESNNKSVKSSMTW